MHITSLAALIEHSTIKRSKPGIDEHLSSRNQYYYRLLRELYRDVRFFHKRLKSGSAVVDKRLNTAARAFLQTARSSPPELVNIFFTSLAENEECRRFLIDRLGDHDGGDVLMDAAYEQQHLPQ